MVFTEELIVQNPICVEIKELVDDAKESFERGDIEAARIKTEEALLACESSILQVSIPKKRPASYEFALYLGISIVLAFMVGIIYYFIQRWRMRRRAQNVEPAINPNNKNL